MLESPFQYSSILKSVHAKLYPRRFAGITPEMSATVGYMLGANYRLPAIGELTVVGNWPLHLRAFLLDGGL